MGDRNQILFGLKFRDLLRPPYLEVGSREYGRTSTFRNVLPHGRGEYVGVDLAPGDGVDRVIDLTVDFGEVDRVLPERFNTVFCLSVLEHCLRPHEMAANVQRLLHPGGTLYVSVPFCWKIHHYPSDYWRFTPDAVKALFPGLDFPADRSAYHSSVDGWFTPGDEPPPAIDLCFTGARKRFGDFRAFWIAIARRLGLLGPLLRYNYIYPPLQLDMIGCKCPET